MLRKFNVFVVRTLLHFTKVKDNYVVFESANHIYDNSYYLYKYLKQFKRIHMFYIVYNKQQLKEAKEKDLRRSNILLISNRINIHLTKNMFYIIKWKKILRQCKLCFFSYRNFYKEYGIRVYDDQILVNISHGQFPIKNVYDYYEGLCIDNFNNLFFRLGTEEALQLLPKYYEKLNCKWMASFMPRLDSLKENKFFQFCKLLNISPDAYKNNKYILLMTTLRRQTDGSYFETQFPFKTTDNDFKVLNNWLKDNNIMLIIKAHHDVLFSSDDLVYKTNNITFVEDDDLFLNDLFVNNLFNYVHALITDFSSVLFDFLYCDKPVGFLLGDLIDRNYHNDFLLNQKDYVCGDTIRNFDELILFLRKICNNNDEYAAERKRVFNKFNGGYTDCYSKEIANIFINKKYLR